MARITLVTTVGLLLAITGTLTAADDDPTQQPLRWKLRRDDDRIEMKVETETTQLSIHSPSGIGRAVLERTGTAWPRKLVLQLHLTGLELFRITSGETVVGVALGSADGRLHQRSWRGTSEEQELRDDDPLRLEVRARDAQGMPATKLPLKEGRLEIEVPAEIFRENPASITLEWIDFYRQ